VVHVGFILKVSDDAADVAYLRLPSHSEDESCKMSKSIRLHEILGVYQGPEVILDFDQRGVLVGIEVLA
jgi:uncharacterized protein YuzE